jgi:hypothetical protein
VKKVVNESWESELRKSIQKQTSNEKPKEESSKYYDVIQAPYIRGFTEKLQKDLSNLNIGFVMKKTQTISSLLCRTKSRKKREEDKDNVYLIKCESCQKPYVGETSQTFQERCKQHKRDVRNGNETNGIYCHLKENPGHEILWEEFQILHKESHWKRRKIKESLIINAINPQEDINSLMNLEKGLEITPIWNILGSGIKKELKLDHCKPSQEYHASEEKET